MPPAYVDALVDVADDGISFEGLTVESDENGYRLQTPASDHSELSEGELERVVTGSPYAANWYFWHAVTPQRDDYWAFLRWVEGAPPDPVESGETSAIDDRYDTLAKGTDQVWGQLLLTVTLDADMQRQYQLRHAADADTPGAELETFDSPAAAREIARFDGRDRYRPLKTAPTLRTGWRFDELDATDVLTAIESFYPASVENWYLESEGELDVTHWHETASRQTGIYGVVETWDRGEGHDHVEWVAETCCVDSECRKRRTWHYDDETELSADGGEGEFPCREPCSLVIAAARKWTRLEGEQSRTYEFELTPSEKEQLEEIVDAIATGEIENIREADFGNGANRWRTRFLREKLFDSEGNLDGVPTDGS